MSDSKQTPECERTRDEQPRIPDHELIRLIGRGSYGKVWLAQTAVGTLRAVKIVHRDHFENARPYEREYAGLKLFEPVSRAHEGLVDVLQLGRDDEKGYFYYVMEAADDVATRPQANPGAYEPRTLEREIRNRGRLPVTECLQIGSAMAAALAFMHQSRLVHRDVKPSNIIFVNGLPKLADIGLVAIAGAAGTFVGTEGFVPPEGPGTVQADIYSLGKVIYEISIGRDRQAFPSLPTQLAELPDRKELVELNHIINKACASEPGHRYRAATDLQDDLELLRSGRSLSRFRRKRKLMAIAKAIAVAGVLVAAVFAGWHYHKSRKPLELREVRRFIHPEVSSWSEALLGDFDGDGETDIFVTTKDKLVVLSAGNQPLNNPNRSKFPEDGFGISLLADLDGDGKDEVFLRWREDLTNLITAVYNQNLFELYRFRATGSIKPPKHGPGGASGMEAARIATLNQDSRKLLIARLSTGYARNPRGLRCYDLETARLLWDYPTAPIVIGGVALADLNHDGKSDLVFGCMAPCNGNALLDGTDDANSYLYAVSHEGTLLWRQTTGGPYTTCEPLIVDGMDGTEKAVLARVCVFMAEKDAAGEVRTYETGQLIKCDLAGHLLTKYDAGTALLSFAVANLDGDGRPRVLATDRRGCLHVLDSELKCLRRIEIMPPRFHGPHDSVDLHLDAEADLNGDGAKELILHSSQVQFRFGLNAGQLDRESQVRFYHDNCVLVLTSALKPLASYTLAEEWKVDPGVKVRVARLGKGRQGLFVLGAEATLLELAKGE